MATQNTASAVMSMADPNLTNLKDVQRELDAIKAERRRRQRALYDIHPPASSSHEAKTQQALFASTVRPVLLGNSPRECDEYQLPYRPEASVPLQLLTMAYMARPDGALSPCPTHFMGSKVKALDLSPWNVSSTEQTDALWRENRCIESLKLSGGKFELDQDEIFRALTRVGPQLTSLELSGCSGVTSKALTILLGGLGQELTNLDLSECLDMGDEHVVEVTRGCPFVTSLDLSSCREVTDQGLAMAASNGGLSSLRRLVVSYCPGVGDSGLRAVLGGCLTLRELSAGGCPEVTGRAFFGGTYAGGVATAPVRGLEWLELPDCQRLDQSAVEWIVAGCTALRSLVVSGCTSTKPEGVELLAASHPDLLRLGLAGCVGLGGSTALSFIAERSGHCLRHLDISDIPVTAAAAVGKVLQRCGRLEFIDLSGLRKVNRSSFYGLAGRRSQRLGNDSATTAADPCGGANLTSRTDSTSFTGSVAREGEGTNSRAYGNPSLPHLRVARMLRLPSLDDASMVWFANACPILEELRVSDSPMVTSACLVPLAALCPLLRSLGLDRCQAATDELALAAMCQSLPGLENLAVGVAVDEQEDRGRNRARFNPRRGGHGDISGSRASGGSHRNLRLSSRRAPYGGAPDGSSCSSATRSLDPDSGLKTFTGETLLAAASSYCARLTTLGLEGHKKLTFSSGHCHPGMFPCLTELRLVGCTAVDDAGLLVFLKACPRVRSLCLSGSGVSQAGLVDSTMSANLSFVETLPPAITPAPVRVAESRPVVPSHRRMDTAAVHLGQTSREQQQAIVIGQQITGDAVFWPMPPPSLMGKQQPQTIGSSSSMAAIRKGTKKAALAEFSTAGFEKSSSSGGGGSSLGVGATAVSEIAMATGMRPSKHHELHLAAAAVMSRFDEEQRALKTLGRALRHFRDMRTAILMSSAKAICRAMLSYRFKTSDGQPDKMRLECARKAARTIQGLVRQHSARKRDASATKFQSLWKRYTARCMYVHQLRLRRSAIGFQRMWRGYYVRTRYRVREKVRELKLAKKVLGKQWFKQAAASRRTEQDPENIAAEKRLREEMRLGIQKCASFVRGERQRLDARAASKLEPILEGEETVNFGTLPPAPRRQIVRGQFDVHPKAKRLRDGREVPFNGEARLALPPKAKVFSSGKGGGIASVTTFESDTKKVKDPDDFDVFRKGPGELWDEDESGVAGAKALADKAWEQQRAAESTYDKERTLCAHCKRRFCSVSCTDCRRAYCLRCSGHVHSQPTRLGHDLGPFQRPERTTKASGRGLDGGGGTKKYKKKAKMAARTLPACARRAAAFVTTMKVLKHKEAVSADQERVKMKMKDRREMEEAEERERKAGEEYARASAGEKNAATMVQKTCQSYMKRLQRKRESELRRRSEDEETKFKTKESVTRVQALYRGFSVRLFLKESPTAETNPSGAVGGRKGSGVEPTTAVIPAGIPRLLPGMSRDKTVMEARVRRDCMFRRRWEREASIAEMKHLIEECDREFIADVRWAMDKHATLQGKSTLLMRRRGNARSAWNRLQVELSRLDPALPPEDPEKKRLLKEIELQDLRILHQTNLFEVTEKGLYWTRAFIRQHFRRHAANVASKAGADHTFAWLEEELYALDEVVAFASKRLEGAADVLEQEFFRGWLTDQIARAGKQRLVIDLEQENLLEMETAHCLKRKTHGSKCRENIEELLKAYNIDTQLGAERVGAELASACAEEETDEKFVWVSRVTRLKDKEEAVRTKVQASLQSGLEEEIAAEDRYLNEDLKFAGDVADAPIPHFAKIKASLVEPPHHPAHLSFESWRKVYRAQPWLAAQTQAEHKRKAARANTIERLEELRAVTAAAKSQEAFAAKEVAALKAQLEGFEEHLAFKGSGAVGAATSQVPLSGEDRTRMEIDLVTGREKLADQEERLERRRKANSKKEEELKNREADLQAEITAEEERHARQAAAMASFRAAERDETAAQFGKEHADAAVARMKTRLDKLKAMQEELSDEGAAKQKTKQEKGFMGTLVGFALGSDGADDDKSEHAEMHYAEQTQLIAKKAKIALVNRQIEDLKKAKKAISMDYASADAQLALAEDIFVGDDGGKEATKDAQKMQERVRQAKQRAIDAKEEQENQLQLTKAGEAAQKAREAKAKAEVDMARRVAEEMGMGSVGKHHGIVLAAQRIKRKAAGEKTIYGGTFDNENAAVEAAIKSRHKAKLGKVEAVVDFAFTVGTEESDAFASKQARLESQGLPCFRKMTKGLGGKDCVFLWVRKTMDSSEFITEVQVTHADPGNPSYKNLKPLGFTPYGHPQLAAKIGSQPSILVWGKKDPKNDGIADIDLSYSQADEKKLSDVGFKMVPGKLADCGLPDVRLWYSPIKRGAQTLPSVKAILHEIGEVRDMCKQNPGDAKLLEIESRLESKLAQAREAEEKKDEDCNNPLKSAIETYALTGMNVDEFISHFAAIDVKRQGTIEIGAFFEYFEWPRNAFANHLFSFMESADEDNRVDFGDFVKLVCSYCMFGKADLLRYAYTVYDQGKGFVSFGDLMSLLNDIHKTNPGPIEKALRDADIARIGQLSFSHFLDLDRRFPKMFYPVANLQLEMRKKFLGEAFWIKKMHMFNEARENILKEAGGSAPKAHKAKLREEELMYLKTKTREALVATQKKTHMVANRVRQKIEGTKWMSKLLS